MRRAARVDTNQGEIVQALRSLGASVAITSMVGNGFPDIVVGYQDCNYLIEIKDGSKPPSKRKLTKDEKEFHLTWRGAIKIANSIEDAMAIIGVDYENKIY